MEDQDTAVFHPMDQFVIEFMNPSSMMMVNTLALMASLSLIVLPLVVTGFIAKRRPLWLAVVAGFLTFQLVSIALQFSILKFPNLGLQVLARTMSFVQ